MTTPAAAARRSSVVRHDGPGGPTRDDRALVREVQRTTEEWIPLISAFVHRTPPAPVVVTLRRGTWVSRTRGTHVLVPVAPGARAEAAAGAVKAALAHELVHAVAGRLPHDVLNEGLAVHVDSTLRLAGPSWPFCDLPPHRWVAVFREEGSFTPLAALLSGRAAPQADSPVDAVILGWARYYLQAGSFVGFLVGEIGMERFLASDAARAGGPVVADLLADLVAGPGAGPGGPAALEERWLASLGGPPTEAEWRLRDDSVRRQVDRHRGAGRPAGCVRPPA